MTVLNRNPDREASCPQPISSLSSSAKTYLGQISSLHPIDGRRNEVQNLN